jgi:glutathione S-transferase
MANASNQFFDSKSVIRRVRILANDKMLVHDGAVHIESNDIIQYLETTFPLPKLIPAGHENEVALLLKHEDDFHLDLRTLSFRFVFARPGPQG